MVSLIFLGFALVAFLAGVAGSFFIVRRLSGLPAVAAFLVWLAAPFILLYAAFTMSVDPTLSPEKASYNVAMAFTITSFMIAIPWAVANLIGGLMGRRRETGAAPRPPVV